MDADVGSGNDQHILGPELLSKSEAASQADQLADLPRYYEVARAWCHLGGEEEARVWLAREAIRDAHNLAKLSRGLLGSSFDGSQKRGIYGSVETDLYDLDAIETGCSAFFEADGLTPTERERIKALRQGVEIMRESETAVPRRGDSLED